MNKKLTAEEFIERAKQIHGDKYDYSKVEYKGINEKICIICPIHGEFWQKPSYHLRKHGCPLCGGNVRYTSTDFIKIANKIHDYKYDYSKVDYINAHTKVCIICQTHGEFWQTPYCHNLLKQGCPKCNSSKLEEEIRLFLRKNNIEFEEQKRFDWLGKQSLDFYLPKYKIAIECQGEQHFKAINRFGGINGLKNIIEHDKRKYKLCAENEINILYYSNLNINYPYKVFEHNEKLLEEIKKGW